MVLNLAISSPCKARCCISLPVKASPSTPLVSITVLSYFLLRTGQERIALTFIPIDIKLPSEICGFSGGTAPPRSEAAADTYKRLDVHRRRDRVSGPALQVEAEDNENRAAYLQPCRGHGSAAAREGVNFRRKGAQILIIFLSS